MSDMIDIDLDFDGLPLHCNPQIHLGHGHQGPAVIACVVDGVALWVHNGQYASKVRFCPYCGKPSSDVTVEYADESSDTIVVPRAADDLEPPLRCCRLDGTSPRRTLSGVATRRAGHLRVPERPWSATNSMSNTVAGHDNVSIGPGRNTDVRHA